MEEETKSGCMIFIGITLLVIGIFLGMCIRPNKIESKTKIEPTLKLTVEDNVIDTLYIYKDY